MYCFFFSSSERFFKTRFSGCMLYRHNAAIGTNWNLFFWDNSLYLKVIVTVKSSGCQQIGFGPQIIDYICIFLFYSSWTNLIFFFNLSQVSLFRTQMKENTFKLAIKSARMTKKDTEESKGKWVYSLLKQIQWMRLFITQGDE